MSWKSLLKSHRSGNTEWYGERADKIREFNNEKQARNKMYALNNKLSGNEPKWQLYHTPPMPIMLKRVFV